MSPRADMDGARAAVIRNAVMRANSMQSLEAHHRMALQGLDFQSINAALDLMAQRDLKIGNRTPPVLRFPGVFSGLILWANVDPNKVTGNNAAVVIHGEGRVVMVADDACMGEGGGDDPEDDSGD